MTRLLDTSALLAHFFNEPGQVVVSELMSSSDLTVGISVLTIYELSTRLRSLGLDVRDIENTITAYTQALDFVAPVTQDIALLAADLRARATHRIAAVDVLIAATAVSNTATLVHRDPHFTFLPPGTPNQIILPDKN